MKIFWKTYAFFFLFITSIKFIYFFSSAYPSLSYYHMMIAFEKGYTFYYLFNILNLTTTLLSIFVVFFYAFNVPWARSLAAKLFWVRIFSEFTGHHYEIKYLQSFFSQNFQLGLTNLYLIIIPILPSYLAHYRYAFNLGTRT